MRIAVIHHSADGAARIGRYLLADFCAAFAAAGHEVVHLSGPSRFTPADVALLHVNLSVVPDDYVALGLRYPVLLNRSVVDTRKRRISQARLAPGETFAGPVIVKTDLNHGGVPERARQPWWRALALGPRRRAAALDYPIFASLGAVPADLRGNPDFVIEKFLPEREGDDYFVRQAYFLGDRDICWRIRSKRAVIRHDAADMDVEIATPPALRRYRRELGLDYGKIDYVEHGGEVVVLDVNKTMGGRGTAPRTVSRLAPGIVSTCHGRLDDCA